MTKQNSTENITPAVLVYHGKVLTSYGNTPDIFPPTGHFLWENFNSFAQKHYFSNKDSCGVIPIITNGREILLFFDTFSKDVAPNMQLFFDETASEFTDNFEAPYLLYEEMRSGGLSPAVSEDIFLEKYYRVITVASFFDIERSSFDARQINLRETIKTAFDLFSARYGEVKLPSVHIMPQVTDNASITVSPLAFCSVLLLALSLICGENKADDSANLCVSKSDDKIEISFYTNSPSENDSIPHSESRAGLFDIFSGKSSEVALLFRLADASRISISYGTEKHRFYLTISFNTISLPPALKVGQFSSTEEKILSILADFLI